MKEENLDEGKDPSLPSMHLTPIIRVVLPLTLIFQQSKPPKTRIAKLSSPLIPTIYLT